MERQGKYVAVLACFVALLSGLSAELGFACPDFVSINQKLTCSCIFRGTPTGSLQFSWLGHSNTSEMEIPSVQQSDNGTQFTCQMIHDGQTSTVVYTLQVAYGPSEVSISGLSNIVNNSALTLTCTAAEVNPQPAYSWTNVSCDNGNQGNTCTFTPMFPRDEGRTVTCTAVNSNVQPTGKTVSQTGRLSLNYPPPDPPVITGYTEGQALSTGDILTCTVRGGNPLVASIIFYCLNPPHHAAGSTVSSNSSKSRILTINTTLATSDVLTCACIAFWNPYTDLYSPNHRIVNVTVDYTPPSTTTTATQTTESSTAAVTTTTTEKATTATAVATTRTTTSQVTTTTTGTTTSTITEKATTSSATTATAVSTTSASATTSSTSSGPSATSAATQTSEPATTAAESSSTTARVSDTPTTTGPSSGTTDGVTSPSKDDDEFPVAAFAGGLAGAVCFIIIIIIIIVLCRRGRERDVTLVSSGEYADGAYKSTTVKDLYAFENESYDKPGMTEIQPSEPVNSTPTAFVNPNNNLQLHHQDLSEAEDTCDKDIGAYSSADQLPVTDEDWTQDKTSPDSPDLDLTNDQQPDDDMQVPEGDVYAVVNKTNPSDDSGAEQMLDHAEGPLGDTYAMVDKHPSDTNGYTVNPEEGTDNSNSPPLDHLS